MDFKREINVYSGPAAECLFDQIEIKDLVEHEIAYTVCFGGEDLSIESWEMFVSLCRSQGIDPDLLDVFVTHCFTWGDTFQMEEIIDKFYERVYIPTYPNIQT